MYPEVVLLAEGLQAAEGEEQGQGQLRCQRLSPTQRSCWVPTQGALPTMPGAESYLELGSFSFLFQSLLWVYRARR